MAVYDYSNNARTTLSSSIGTSDTSLSVASGSAFPTSNFYVTLTQDSGTETSWEIVLCSSRSGNTLTVTRGQDGTSAASWASGSRVTLRLVNALMDQWPQAAAGAGVPISDGTSTWTATATTGTGSVVRATSPTLTTPTIGAATATTVNKVTITAPTTGATLTLADGSSLVTSGANSITLTSTGATSVTLPTSGTLVNSAVATLSSLASIGTITTGVWQGTVVGVTYGGTGANLSATGGSNQVLKQSTVGGAITVGTLASTNLSDTANIVLLTGAQTISGAKTFYTGTLILGDTGDPPTTGLVLSATGTIASNRTVNYGDPGGTTTLGLISTTSTTTTHLAHATAVAGVMSFSALAVADLPALNGFTDGTVFSLLNDRHPHYNNSAAANRDGAANEIAGLATAWYSRIYSECYLTPGTSSADNALVGVTSSGTITYTTGEASHPGILTLSTSTSTTGLAGLSSAVGGTAGTDTMVGAGTMWCRVWIKTSASLSDGTDTYFIRVGYDSSGTLVNGTDYIFFRYTHSENSGKWQACTRTNSGTETSTDTGVTVATSTWYLLQITVNAAGTSVDFSIGTSGATPSTVATVTTTIPVNRTVGKAISIIKTAGTTARTIGVDAYNYIDEFTTAR